MHKLKTSFVLTGCLLAAAGLSLSSTHVSAAPAAPKPQSQYDIAASQDAEILHLLNRISFGPMPGDIENVRAIGIDDYIEQQLHPQILPRVPELDAKLAPLSTLNMPITKLAEEYEARAGTEQNLSDDQKKELNKRRNIAVEELTEAKIMRALISPAQLQEVMVDFWFNHFNVFAEKGADKFYLSSYERDAIRPYALGKFRDLLEATAHHPAMLFYLDNWLNTDPNSPLARNKKIGINENYAREVMELHTLGVNGGYTQQDVTTLAHILTGWGLTEGKELEQRSSFMFDPRRHDYSNKIFLGYQIRGGGDAEVEQVLDILARNPATAKHIAYELAQYFVADDPPQSLVNLLSATFLSSGGDITVVLRTLFKSQEFWDPQYRNNKFKPPFRYVVSALRASGVMPSGDTKLLQGAINQMGEPLYRCLTPNGYANTNDQWQNSDALLKRIDFANRLNSFIGPNAAQTITEDLGRNWSAKTLDAVQSADPKMRPVLLLSSPEFVEY
jgi:uncharacterized protein (DUF1800 family)